MFSSILHSCNPSIIPASLFTEDSVRWFFCTTVLDTHRKKLLKLLISHTSSMHILSHQHTIITSHLMSNKAKQHTDYWAEHQSPEMLEKSRSWVLQRSPPESDQCYFSYQKSQQKRNRQQLSALASSPVANRGESTHGRDAPYSPTLSTVFSSVFHVKPHKSMCESKFTLFRFDKRFSHTFSILSSTDLPLPVVFVFNFKGYQVLFPFHL